MVIPLEKLLKVDTILILSGDEPTTWKKIEECIPREDTDMDTDKRFLNYEDPDWSKDEYEWYKNEDGTDIKKEAHGSTNT